MRKKPKVPLKWLKDPLFAKPKKGHEYHGWSEWQGTYTGAEARGCRRARCRCMHWCCYQQRHPRRRR